MTPLPLLKYLDATPHSDVTLELPSGRYIKAHKVILAAESAYFRAALEGDFQESQQIVVKLSEEHDEQLLLEMLHFIYAHELPSDKLSEDSIKIFVRAKDLLGVATYYQAPGLADAAAKLFTDFLTTEIGVYLYDERSTIIVATLNSCEVGTLRAWQSDLVTAISKSGLRQWMKRPDFRAMISKHTHLGAALLCKLHDDDYIETIPAQLGPLPSRWGSLRQFAEEYR